MDFQMARMDPREKTQRPSDEHTEVRSPFRQSESQPEEGGTPASAGLFLHIRANFSLGASRHGRAALHLVVRQLNRVIDPRQFFQSR
jgi:hypothetical protein